MNNIQGNRKFAYQWFMAYLIITLGLNFWGPIEYLNYSKIQKFYVFSFMFFFGICCSLVFKIAMHNSVIHIPRLRIDKNIVIKFLQFSIIYSVIIKMFQFFDGIKNFPLVSLNNLFLVSANAYIQNEFVFTYSNWIISYTNVFIVFSIIIGGLYFKGLSFFYKIIYIFLVFISIINNSIIYGTQKEFADFILYYFTIFEIQIGINYRRNERKRKKQLFILGFLVIICIGAMLATRIDTHRSLYGGNALYLQQAMVNNNNVILKFLPKSLQEPLILLVYYFSHGYYGLSLCLQIPFAWSGFLGSSYALTSDMNRWFPSIVKQFSPSYLIRLSDYFGYNGMSSWCTIFPWFASDFSFAGAVVIVLIGVYFSFYLWKEVLNTQNPFSVALLGQMNIFLFYIPCNNQLFQTRKSILTLIFLFIFWFFFHGHRKEFSQK